VDFWSKMWRGWGGMPQFGEKARLLSFGIPVYLGRGVALVCATQASILGSTSAHVVVGKMSNLMRGTYFRRDEPDFFLLRKAY
jgi:hypothetical protein